MLTSVWNQPDHARQSGKAQPDRRHSILICVLIWAKHWPASYTPAVNNKPIIIFINICHLFF